MLLTPLILAIGFITPAFAAAGALLVSIPIIIHILNKRRFKTVIWAAMDFLLAAMQKNRRRLQFEQWLLLAIRCLLIALAGIALARPLGCSSNSTMAGLGQAGVHVIIIDNSFTMQYAGDGGKSHLDDAKLRAKNYVDSLGSGGGDSVVVITASAPAGAPIAAPNFDLAEVKAAIDRIQPTFAATDLAGAFRKAVEIAQQHNQISRRNLLVIHDSSRSAWENGQGDALAKSVAEAAKLFRVVQSTVGDAQQSNAAVVSVAPRGATLVTSRFPVDISADIRAFGSPRKVDVVWQLGNVVLTRGKQSITADRDLKPATLAGEMISTPGARDVAAAISPKDALPADNIRYRTLDVENQVGILVVEGDNRRETFGSSASFFFRTALVGDGQNPAAYAKIETISPIEIGSKILDPYRILVLVNVPTFTPSDAEKVEKFVRSGGSLILFMGAQVQPKNYNDELGSRKLLPGTLLRIVTGKPGYRLDFNPRGNLHPFLADFAGEERSGLDQAVIFSYAQFDVPKEAGVERVLNYVRLIEGQAAGVATNDPAITAHSLGRGQVVTITTSANDEWSELPARPNYTAVIHAIVRNCVSASERWMNLTVGDKLAVPAKIRVTKTPILTDPDKKPITLASADGGGFRSNDTLATPGIYRLDVGAAVYPIAVNIDPAESDVTYVPAERIVAIAGVPLASVDDKQLAAIADTSDNDYGWPILFIVLVLIGIECVLAMIFGHHRQLVTTVGTRASASN